MKLDHVQHEHNLLERLVSVLINTDHLSKGRARASRTQTQTSSHRTVLVPEAAAAREALEVPRHRPVKKEMRERDVEPSAASGTQTLSTPPHSLPALRTTPRQIHRRLKRALLSASPISRTHLYARPTICRHTPDRSDRCLFRVAPAPGHAIPGIALRPALVILLARL